MARIILRKGKKMSNKVYYKKRFYNCEGWVYSLYLVGMFIVDFFIALIIWQGLEYPLWFKAFLLVALVALNYLSNGFVTRVAKRISK